MTTLVCQKLQSSLTQAITLKNDLRYNIGCISPYLLMVNAPAGTFTLAVKSGGSTLFSKSFTSTDIKTALGTVNNYAHTFHPVIPDNPAFLGRGSYDVVLSASGYSPTGSSFIAWIQQHEDLNNTLDYVPLTDEENPLALRLKIYRSY